MFMTQYWCQPNGHRAQPDQNQAQRNGLVTTRQSSHQLRERLRGRLLDLITQRVRDSNSCAVCKRRTRLPTVLLEPAGHPLRSLGSKVEAVPPWTLPYFLAVLLSFFLDQLHSAVADQPTLVTPELWPTSLELAQNSPFSSRCGEV
jgi:hypothetical protein